MYRSKTYPSYDSIVPLVTCSYASVILTFQSSASPLTAFSSIVLLFVLENLSVISTNFSYSLACFCKCIMKDSDESFQAPVPSKVVVIYIVIVDDSRLALVEVDICDRSFILMAWAL